jgi:hypothetical protein
VLRESASKNYAKRHQKLPPKSSFGCPLGELSRFLKFSQTYELWIDFDQFMMGQKNGKFNQFGLPERHKCDI